MKSLLLFLFFLMLLNNSFGQNSWGSWNTPDCFKGIQFRCRVKDYNSAAKQYTWDVEIKNNYNKKVSLNFDIQNSSIDGRTTINPGATDKSWTLNKSSSSLYITFSKLCFHFPNGFDQCSEYNQKGYASFAECDNGSPKYQVYNGINSSNTSAVNSSNNINSNTQIKTDPNFNSKNASYQDYYKRATAAGQAGNYDEAIALWSAAINVAVNDDQRNNAKAWLAEVQKAKNNAATQTNNAEALRKQQQFKQLQEQQRQQYNNTLNQGASNLQSGNYTNAMQSYTNALNNATTKSEKKVAAAGAVISGVGGVLDAMAKAKEEKRQKLEQERLEQERMRQIKAQQDALASQELEENWNYANKYADLESVEGYKKAIEMMLPFATANKLNGDALNTIGFWYWKLDDFNNARDWYVKSYAKGNANAIRNLGVLYLNGNGVEKNVGFAITYFQKACEAGLIKACNEFKELRAEQEATMDNAKRKSYSDCYYIGESYFSEKDYTKALNYYTQAYINDTSANWNAPLKIAEMYFEKNQLNNKDSAATWYAIAVNNMENDPKQKSNIGKKGWFDDKYTDVLFNYGNAIRDQNGTLAITVYTKAVRDGYTGAYTQIGRIYELGNGGVEKDWSKAKIFYEKDADKNAARAMYYLGQLYEFGGPNLEKSKRESKRWYKKACKADKKYCN